jgi:UPF0755 protein
MAAKARRKSSKQKNTTKKRIIQVLGIVALVAFLFVAFKIFGPNTGSFTEGNYIYIHTGSTYDEVIKTLKDEGFVRDINSFELLAKEAGYKDHVRSGKYKITKGMSNFSIVRLLRSGKQTPVKIVINKLRTKQDFINLIATNLEADSNVLNHIAADTVYLAQYGLDPNTFMCAIMPNTYEFYWDVSAEKVFQKIAKSYVVFWTDERKQKAQHLGLTPQKIIIVASIVEEETNKNDEKSTIASVYLNRIKKGMKLQADPTARFAYGDFTIKRITSVQTNFVSPYNTYQVTGLPPGPICTPSEKSIDAVLNAAKTDYIFFCAKEDFSGYHNFAATSAQHAHNAQLYHDALNARGIR